MMMDDSIYYPMNMLQEQQYSGTNQDTRYSGFAHWQKHTTLHIQVAHAEIETQQQWTVDEAMHGRHDLTKN
jgi:hypothetical protein